MSRWACWALGGSDIIIVILCRSSASRSPFASPVPLPLPVGQHFPKPYKTHSHPREDPAEGQSIPLYSSLPRPCERSHQEPAPQRSSRRLRLSTCGRRHLLAFAHPTNKQQTPHRRPSCIAPIPCASRAPRRRRSCRTPRRHPRPPRAAVSLAGPILVGATSAPLLPPRCCICFGSSRAESFDCFYPSPVIRGNRVFPTALP